jgi:hypothetical protein
MTGNTEESLASFMKKQINAKSKTTDQIVASGKKNLPGLALEKVKAEQKKDEKEEKKEEEKDPNEEEKTEEEKLEEAKKESRAKATEREQTEMMKKILIETISKYALLIAVLAVFAIGLFKFGPGLASFANGAVYKALMGALGQK